MCEMHSLQWSARFKGETSASCLHLSLGGAQGSTSGWAGLTIQMSKAPAGLLAALSYALEDAKTIQPLAGVQPGMVSSQGPSVSLVRPLASPSAGMMNRFL